MRGIEKILNQLEDCIRNGSYKPLETEGVEIKPTPPSLNASTEILKSICAFMNTNGGIIIVGVKETTHGLQKVYELKGYNDDFEGALKLFKSKFTDRSFNTIDVGDYIHYQIESFMDNRVCIIYVDELPDDLKYTFFEKEAYKRIITGDHKIDSNTIEIHEEFKEENKNARELLIHNDTSIQDIDLDRLNEYIQLLNREIKIETIKATIDDAKAFLSRKKFIIGDKITTLGLLVCGKHIKDFLGWRSQVDGFVDTPYEVAQDKKSLVDNVIPLMEKSLGYILKNIQVGVSSEKGGISKPEYPEQLLRETINNAIAHRDYSIEKYINITIKPNDYIEIRNPGSFKKQLLIDIINHDIPVRRIIPDSKPRNPKLADVLKVFDKWEGRSKGMSNLVNEALNNKMDLPYYRFYSKDDLGLFIQKGKLVDDNFVEYINSFDFFIENHLNGSSITSEEMSVLAYFYKSEKANQQYRHTILLTHDNNHTQAIQRLNNAKLIFKHPDSPELYPVYLVNRELIRDEYYSELRAIFGGSFDSLPEINKQTLSLIYQVNTYSKDKSISATKAGRLLFLKTNKAVNDTKEFDNFKRKMYKIFKKLVEANFLIVNGRNYFINKNYERVSSLFDK